MWYRTEQRTPQNHSHKLWQGAKISMSNITILFGNIIKSEICVNVKGTVTEDAVSNIPISYSIECNRNAYVWLACILLEEQVQKN